MQHGERERSLQVEVARLRKLHEDTEDARCVLLAELRASERALAAANARADAAEADFKNACAVGRNHEAEGDHLRTRLLAQDKELVSTREAIAAARRECGLLAEKLKLSRERRARCLFSVCESWLQFAYEVENGPSGAQHDGGLSTLEDIREGLAMLGFLERADDKHDWYVFSDLAVQFMEAVFLDSAKALALLDEADRARDAKRAALAAPAAAAVRDPATEDADAAWRDGEAHGRDPK